MKICVSYNNGIYMGKCGEAPESQGRPEILGPEAFVQPSLCSSGQFLSGHLTSLQFRTAAWIGGILRTEVAFVPCSERA